jgi:hypothetical protein
VCPGSKQRGLKEAVSIGRRAHTKHLRQNSHMEMNVKSTWRVQELKEKSTGLRAWPCC